MTYKTVKVFPLKESILLMYLGCLKIDLMFLALTIRIPVNFERITYADMRKEEEEAAAAMEEFFNPKKKVAKKATKKKKSAN